MAAMSQIASSSKPALRRASWSASFTSLARSFTFMANSSIAFCLSVMSALRQLATTWSAISGFLARMRRIAPCATTQYWHWLREETATTIISRSALVSPSDLSISVSW